MPAGPRAPSPVQTLSWLRRPMDMMEECRERYGPTFTLKLVHEGTFVFVSEPEAIKQVFSGGGEALHGGEGRVILTPLLGPNSMMVTDGEPHLRQRKLLLPAFSKERVGAYEDIIRQATRESLASWPEGQEFELHPRMQEITLDVVIRAVFGADDDARFDALRTKITRLLNWISSKRHLLMWVASGPKRVERISSFRKARDPVREILMEEIERRRNDPSREERSDVLSLLLGVRDDEGNPMTDIELRDALMTTLIVGHETTANSLGWAFERLLHHPEVYDKATEAARREDMDYIGACVKETQRVAPAAAIAVRRLNQPFEVDGYTLPKGINVAACIYLLHHHPDLYPEPHEFRPERFLGHQGGAYDWIPFGGGLRKCPGGMFAHIEMMLIVQTVLSQVRLRAPDPTRPESLGRRLILFTPGEGARAVMERA